MAMWGSCCQGTNLYRQWWNSGGVLLLFTAFTSPRYGGRSSKEGGQVSTHNNHRTYWKYPPFLIFGETRAVQHWFSFTARTTRIANVKVFHEILSKEGAACLLHVQEHHHIMTVWKGKYPTVKIIYNAEWKWAAQWSSFISWLVSAVCRWSRVHHVLLATACPIERVNSMEETPAQTRNWTRDTKSKRLYVIVTAIGG